MEEACQQLPPSQCCAAHWGPRVTHHRPNNPPYATHGNPSPLPWICTCDPWRDVKDHHSCIEDLETSLYPFTNHFLALTPSYSHNKYLAQKSNRETHLSFASCFLSWPPFYKFSSLCWRLLPRYLVFPLSSGQWNHLLGYNSNNELGI